MMKNHLPNIFILYTGGTMGMQKSPTGLRPTNRLPEDVKPILRDYCHADWQIIEPLIDSSAINIAHWQNWLDIIATKMAYYDGILIIHGTDTMAYTAAVLAHAIKNPPKPIVLTGAQKSLYETTSDATDNLKAAIALLCSDYCDIGIVFANRLLDAKNSSKISTHKKEAFADRYNQPLGIFDKQRWHFFRQPEKRKDMPFAILPISEQVRIFTLYFTPGQSVDLAIDIMQNHRCDGLILLTYGTGNAPNRADFINALKQFIHNGGVVYNVSQIPLGESSARYAQNYALCQAGIINGENQGVEAVYAQLLIQLSQKNLNHQ